LAKARDVPWLKARIQTDGQPKERAETHREYSTAVAELYYRRVKRPLLKLLTDRCSQLAKRDDDSSDVSTDASTNFLNIGPTDQPTLSSDEAPSRYPDMAPLLPLPYR
jgi:hypothetical protein